MRIGQNPDYPPEVSRVDRDIDIVDQLRLGGPNAMEVADQAADEIERLRSEVRTLKDKWGAIVRMWNDPSCQ